MIASKSFIAWEFGETRSSLDQLHRWYDAVVGRWISEDPIGFALGDANLYRYVGNGVTTSSDPSGLHEYLYNPGGATFGNGHGLGCGSLWDFFFGDDDEFSPNGPPGNSDDDANGSTKVLWQGTDDDPYYWPVTIEAHVDRKGDEVNVKVIVTFTDHDSLDRKFADENANDSVIRSQLPNGEVDNKAKNANPPVPENTNNEGFNDKHTYSINTSYQNGVVYVTGDSANTSSDGFAVQWSADPRDTGNLIVSVDLIGDRRDDHRLR